MCISRSIILISKSIKKYWSENNETLSQVGFCHRRGNTISSKLAKILVNIFTHATENINIIPLYLSNSLGGLFCYVKSLFVSLKYIFQVQFSILFPKLFIYKQVLKNVWLSHSDSIWNLQFWSKENTEELFCIVELPPKSAYLNEEFTVNLLYAL